MPALLTHYLCGDAVLKSINIDDIKNVTSKYRNLFNLGTQGPDIFFYHNAWPWAKGESLSKLGSRLHDDKVKAFFSSALEVIDMAQETEKEKLLSYIYGYVCHHSLDIHAHPYIFYKTGFVVDETDDKKKYDAFHRRFEAEIDAMMAKEILNKSAYEILSHRLITISKEEAHSIAAMYNIIFKSIYNMDIPIGEIRKAAKDMASITKALRDPFGIKKSVLAFAERRIYKYQLISNMIYPLKIDSSLDHLNINRSIWYYPWDKSFPQYSSFTDLFNEAEEEAEIMCKSINEYISGNIGKDKVLNILGNRSFSSGLDCDKNIKFQYYDMIYPKIVIE